MRTVHLHGPDIAVQHHVPESAGRLDPWLWLVGGAALFFAVPFVGTELLDMPRDLYYLGYLGVVVVFSAAFVATYRSRLTDLWQHNWRWSLAVGALAGAAVAGIVLSTAGTAHPEGWRWWFEIGWRGVVYGSTDTVALFVFPAAVAHLVMHGNRTGARRRIGFGLLALALSLLVSTSYHLGYAEYRDADLRSPLIGTVIADSSVVLTGNPVGAFLTHTTAHVTSVVHQYEGGPTHMLPPKPDEQE
jgi:hypothetical protein